MEQCAQFATPIGSISSCQSIYFFQSTQIFVKQLCHVGELSTFEPQAVALEPINAVGNGSWGLICGQIDLWVEAPGEEKKHQEKYMYRCHRLMYAYSLHCNSHVASLGCLITFMVSICCAGASRDIDWTSRKNTAFADHLLKTLGKGAESCQGIQEAARCVVEESNGNCLELTKWFARIGTSGRNPQNCERDLFRLINLPVESWLCWCKVSLRCVFVLL